MSLFVYGFIAGWGGCTLFFTAVAILRPGWPGDRRSSDGR